MNTKTKNKTKNNNLFIYSLAIIGGLVLIAATALVFSNSQSNANTSCADGYFYDTVSERCVQLGTGAPVDNDYCERLGQPSGYVWDTSTQECVENADSNTVLPANSNNSAPIYQTQEELDNIRCPDENEALDYATALCVDTETLQQLTEARKVIQNAITAMQEWDPGQNAEELAMAWEEAEELAQNWENAVQDYSRILGPIFTN